MKNCLQRINNIGAGIATIIIETKAWHLFIDVGWSITTINKHHKAILKNTFVDIADPFNRASTIKTPRPPEWCSLG